MEFGTVENWVRKQRDIFLNFKGQNPCINLWLYYVALNKCICFEQNKIKQSWGVIVLMKDALLEVKCVQLKSIYFFFTVVNLFKYLFFFFFCKKKKALLKYILYIQKSAHIECICILMYLYACIYPWYHHHNQDTKRFYNLQKFLCFRVRVCVCVVTILNIKSTLLTYHKVHHIVNYGH